MNKIKERKRAANFTLGEELCLVQLVEQKAATIHCKEKNYASLEKKRQAWEQIDHDFILQCGIERGPTKLRLKYDSLKRKAKKRLGGIRPCCTTVEGGTAADGDSDQIEDKMAALNGRVKVEDDGGSPMQYYPSSSAVPVEVAKNEFDVDLSGCIKVENIIDIEHDIESAAHSCHAPDAFLFDGETSGVLNYKPNVPTTATEAQRAFYENEDRRADERHAWNWEKHQWEQQHWLMKGQLLRYELEAKEQKLITDNE